MISTDATNSTQGLRRYRSVAVPSPRISAAYRPNCPSSGNSAVMPQLACAQRVRDRPEGDSRLVAFMSGRLNGRPALRVRWVEEQQMEAGRGAVCNDDGRTAQGMNEAE